MAHPIELTLSVIPVDHDASFTAGMVVGLLRGAGLHVAALDLDSGGAGVDSIADVDVELLDRLRRESVHPADHDLIDDAGAAAAVEAWAAEPELVERPKVDHDAARARAAGAL